MDLQEKKKTQVIIDYLIDLIKTQKVPTNKILPSEHSLMMHFDCSRSIVVKAYQKLEALGAIYSISKRGHFVAENFHNLIKPISYLLGVTAQEGKEIKSKELAQWMVDKRILFVQGFRTFEKTYYKDKDVLATSEIYVSCKNIEVDEEINFNKSLTDLLIERGGLNNMVYSLAYENVKKFGYESLVVVSFFGYDEDSICIAGKYYINPKYFRFFHQEFSLKS
ncbi:GntR family transcriptional regulator [Mycoplasmopsis caviae]|uniref:GntR family transcriptional regulator n=1 Tax=Mycoplasmopsis caviae TaxID=55603 RepID=A0A3P8KA84_9BACT|nr:GntR family transcriptional regulator [Mycoplasmopsis caviae]UUD35637.1 GntR family transcriptional regulator [Mycoplasmopsis caviae]VDR41614.1 GntR family transcriptional regulator [Mycoplasmopsis caviae]